MDDTTFITMHDLSSDARLVYASASINEVLGYEPRDIVGRSCFEYFHPDERPFARSIHGRGVQLDRAAVLSYCRLKAAGGDYVTCECVFTVVHSVIVASTSLYRPTTKSQGRAIAAPAIRKAFSSSPEDPRFHMLTHLSEKFKAPPVGEHEPRAALILNRFTKTSSILYSTNSLNDMLGVELDRSMGMSFYECIQRDCLEDAVAAIEQAKENDSIAYLRFNWRNPTDDPDGRDATYDEYGSDLGHVDPDEEQDSTSTESGTGSPQSLTLPMRAYNGDGEGSAGLLPGPFSLDTPTSSARSSEEPNLVMEAVVSCTSDGLVVVLRRARPIIPSPENTRDQPRGPFVSPWSLPTAAASNPLRRGAAAMDAPVSVPVHRAAVAYGGPPATDFMDSIRQVAVFAWSLRSINENLLQYARPPGVASDEEGEHGEGEVEENGMVGGAGEEEKQAKRFKAGHGGRALWDGKGDSAAGSGGY